MILDNEEELHAILTMALIFADVLNQGLRSDPDEIARRASNQATETIKRLADDRHRKKGVKRTTT